MYILPTPPSAAQCLSPLTPTGHLFSLGGSALQTGTKQCHRCWTPILGEEKEVLKLASSVCTGCYAPSAQAWSQWFSAHAFFKGKYAPVGKLNWHLASRLHPWHSHWPEDGRRHSSLPVSSLSAFGPNNSQHSSLLLRTLTFSATMSSIRGLPKRVH